jgi:hypothetical protein
MSMAFLVVLTTIFILPKTFCPMKRVPNPLMTHGTHPQSLFRPSSLRALVLRLALPFPLFVPITPSSALVSVLAIGTSSSVSLAINREGYPSFQSSHP